MEDVKELMNLLSKQEAATRCGVSRITLLRARKAGKIRFRPCDHGPSGILKHN